MQRRILRLDRGGTHVARESRFESESQLHEAIASHPEVLPNEDFGLGTVVPLAEELDLGSGPMDLLAADASGRLAIVEFKRGTENPDIRHLVAQLLDYGAALWRKDPAELEVECLRRVPSPADSLARHVGDRLSCLGEEFDWDAFQSGLTGSLESGAFTYIYCGRDLDERTRRIMTYLAEGTRIAFFAVEVDYFLDDQGAVLVPRAAFVPSWINVPATASRTPSPAMELPPECRQLVERMDDIAKEMGLKSVRRRTGRQYLPPVLEEGIANTNSGVGVYASGRGCEINLSVFRKRGEAELADDFLGRLQEITSASRQLPPEWPAVPCQDGLHNWERLRDEVIKPYFESRAAPPRVDGDPGLPR